MFRTTMTVTIEELREIVKRAEAEEKARQQKELEAAKVKTAELLRRLIKDLSPKLREAASSRNRSLNVVAKDHFTPEEIDTILIVTNFRSIL